MTTFSASPREAASTTGREVRFEMFRGGVMTPWEQLLASAAAFAGSLPPGCLISISHSADQLDGLVVVWYWSR
jgi:hypothetical protein